MLSVFALHRCGEHSRHPTRSHMELPKLHCYHGWSRFKTLSVCSNDYRTRQHQEWLSISKAGCVWMEPVFGVWNKEISICVIKSPTSPQLSIWSWSYAVISDGWLRQPSKWMDGKVLCVCVCVCVCVPSVPAGYFDFMSFCRLIRPALRMVELFERDFLLYTQPEKSYWSIRTW